MKVMLYIGHPAQYLFFRETIKRLYKNNYAVLIVIKDKDVLGELITNDRFDFFKIIQLKYRNKLSITISLLIREVAFFLKALRFKPDLIIGTDPIVAHTGKLLNISNVITLEDDFDVIPKLTRITYPFCKHILVPNVCKVGEKFENKKIGYSGYMKLAYLHPNIFMPIYELNLLKPYFLLRFSSLKAHHDDKINGLSDGIIDVIINILDKHGTVYISSERILPEKYNKYLLTIDKSKIHSVLYNSEIFISDSQSMSVEAAMLGVPSIRFSDFAGKIGVLEELEKKYQLTFGISADKPDLLLNKVDELLNMEERKESFQKRRQKMLADKIDVTAFLVWFIENYPKSVEIIKENPDYQCRFK